MQRLPSRKYRALRALAFGLLVLGLLVMVAGASGAVELSYGQALTVKLVCMAIAAAGAVWSIENQRRRS